MNQEQVNADIAELEAIYEQTTVKVVPEEKPVAPTKKKAIVSPAVVPPPEPVAVVPQTIPVPPEPTSIPIPVQKPIVVPKSIDEFILETAETQFKEKVRKAEQEKVEFINNAYKKIYSALTETPQPQPTPQLESVPKLLPKDLKQKKHGFHLF
jgi:hypothetical protein